MQNELDNNIISKISDMTPGGLTSSEIMVAQKHYNQSKKSKQKWDV